MNVGLYITSSSSRDNSYKKHAVFGRKNYFSSSFFSLLLAACVHNRSFIHSFIHSFSQLAPPMRLHIPISISHYINIYVDLLFVLFVMKEFFFPICSFIKLHLHVIFNKRMSHEKKIHCWCTYNFIDVKRVLEGRP